MPWGRLDDSLYDHPKLDLIPVEDRLPAIGLWARAISWCNRFLTDGHLPRSRIEKLDGWPELAEHLVAAGLLEVTASGFLIHDFLEFNDSRADILDRREKEAERQRIWRKNKRNKRDGVTDSVTPSVADDDVTPVVTPSVTPVVTGSSRARDVARIPARPGPARPMDSPNPAERGHGSRKNGTNPRAQGINPRAVAARDRAATTWRRNQRQLAYLRGAISEPERIAMDQADAALEDIPDYAEHVARLRVEQNAPTPIEADVEAWTK